MTKRIGVAEAKAKFSELLEAVAHGDEHYIIERHGRPVAALVTPEELEQIQANPAWSSQPKGFLALVGLWADVPDEEIDAMLDEIYRLRDADQGRAVDLSEL